VPTSLETNLARVRQRIARAASRAGRDPAAVALVAVTKDVSAELAAELCRLGQLDLGENRAADLALKAAELAALGPRWHFIGHLQRNKARRVVELAHSVHAIDSLRILETVDRVAGEIGRRPEMRPSVTWSSPARSSRTSRSGG
jgi:uncharacterized pyridoxal phosphate-containing UPF0001 family protein